MKASELRIGNLVYTSKKWIRQIETINRFTVTITNPKISPEDDNSRGRNLIDIYPIPLTEDILLRFQFTLHKSEDGVYFSKTYGENGVIIITKDYHYKGFEFELGKGLFKSIEFVHELQNGYNFLTGEELILQ